MEWVLISGSWRTVNQEVEKDVRRIVKEIYSKGDGLIIGGALGPDEFAIDEWLKLSKDIERLEIYLPTKWETFYKHLLDEVGKERGSEISRLNDNLGTILSKNPEAVLEGNAEEANQESYYARIDTMIKKSHRGYAFHVNNSEGVQYSIDKMKEQKKPIQINKYAISKR